MGSMAAGESAMLKYSRDFEAQADSMGFKWMVKAGYNPRDMVTIFSKMNKQRWLEGGKVPVYLSHPPGCGQPDRGTLAPIGHPSEAVAAGKEQP